jgi:hypothetical protein
MRASASRTFLSLFGVFRGRMRETHEERFLFWGELEDKLGAGVLEIGQRGLRLLVPRRVPRRCSSATSMALALAIGVPLLWATIVLYSAYADSYPYTLILNLAAIGGNLALVSIPRTSFWCRRLARRPPERVVELPFRAVELHRLTQWIWVRAEGKETWVHVFGSRRKVEMALNLAQRTVRVDSAPG